LTAADEADGDANMPDDRHDLDVGLKGKKKKEEGGEG